MSPQVPSHYGSVSVSYDMADDVLTDPDPETASDMLQISFLDTSFIKVAGPHHRV